VLRDRRVDVVEAFFSIYLCVIINKEML
jgi:hypothetical protein